MPSPQETPRCAVILCGGRGSRLRPLTDRVPKALAEVQGRPILQHVLEALSAHGVSEFVLPAGWKAKAIRERIPALRERVPGAYTLVESGVDTPIARRLGLLRPLLARHESFLLVNGDTLFDLDLDALHRQHEETGSVVTLASVELTSRFGLIFERSGRVVDFQRRTRIDGMRASDAFAPVARINAGIAWVRSSVFEHFDPATCDDFEAELYPRLARRGLLGHLHLRGLWHCIDTLQDLEAAQALELPCALPGAAA